MTAASQNGRLILMEELSPMNSFRRSGPHRRWKLGGMAEPRRRGESASPFGKMNRPVALDEKMFGRGGDPLRETHLHITARAAS